MEIIYDLYVYPKILHYEKKIFRILGVYNKDFIIRKCKLIYINNKLKKIKIIEGIHPNCDPKTKIFCSCPLDNTPYDEVETLPTLKGILGIHNLMSYYFSSLVELKYDKKPIYIYKPGVDY